MGYRNDLIVRGGGPSENKFFMDGIEIPNINHFATQGATGGPVSIVNADLIQEIRLLHRGVSRRPGRGAGSVLDFRLRDGNAEKQTFKATLGASDAGVSGSGHIGGRTTYVSRSVSRTSSFLKMLGLPFLPNYIDGQVKVKTRLTERDELTVLALAGIDNMKLNVDEKGEDAEYRAELPAAHPAGDLHRRGLVAALRRASRADRDAEPQLPEQPQPEIPQQRRLVGGEPDAPAAFRRAEDLAAGREPHLCGRWTLRGGVEPELFAPYEPARCSGSTPAACAFRITGRGWESSAGGGFFAGADYASGDRRFTASAGLRADGCDYSARMARPWHQLSPRASVSYVVAPG